MSVTFNVGITAEIDLTRLNGFGELDREIRKLYYYFKNPDDAERKCPSEDDLEVDIDIKFMFNGKGFYLNDIGILEGILDDEKLSWAEFLEQDVEIIITDDGGEE